MVERACNYNLFYLIQTTQARLIPPPPQKKKILKSPCTKIDEKEPDSQTGAETQSQGTLNNDFLFSQSQIIEGVKPLKPVLDSSKIIHKLLGEIKNIISFAQSEWTFSTPAQGDIILSTDLFQW